MKCHCSPKVLRPKNYHRARLSLIVCCAYCYHPQVAKKADADKQDSDLQKKLGMVVRSCRHQLGITQDELAWRSNMHRTYIADIERGARNLSLRSVESLADALQVTVGDLLTYATAQSGTAMRLCAEAAPAELREILVVEDNSADAALIMRKFKRARFSNPLKVTRDAEEALNYLLRQGRYKKGKIRRPQLILLDLNLPGMSGLEFLRKVKSDKRLKDIPVIILTVSKNDRLVSECAELGAANYIVKPLDIEDLVGVTPKLNLHLALAPPTGPKSRLVST